MKQLINIFWFRRDLRLHDNAALYYALKSGLPVLPIFIFDANILEKLDDKYDKRVNYIYDTILNLYKNLTDLGTTLLICHGTPTDVWKKLVSAYNIANVYANHDYEPYAIQRDKEAYGYLESYGIKFNTYKDQVIFEYNEVLKDDSSPFTVFTPYSKRWKAKLNDFYLKSYPTHKYYDAFIKNIKAEPIELQAIGFRHCTYQLPNIAVDDSLIKTYNETRNYPAVKGTSQLSVHLRFGTISIRQLATKAHTLNETFLNELIWREFYMMILWHFPIVTKQAFKPAYEYISWRNNEAEFIKWCEGNTGYAIVDAGMRELNATGYMHNRVRMIVASFLTKHLLTDWRWGEAYFAKKLMDYDLAANNGGWQWCAGCGCDAAPYFRIFNPMLQTLKFDNNMEYIKKWVPEHQDISYVQSAIVDHDFARRRTLEAYSKIK
ncbi:MAG: deoxyribodipyrimidine photo-lyase [Cytophagales bacterium]|nr:deoxyribodipyrimidine photo-lyase [Cytophagales bacterium]